MADILEECCRNNLETYKREHNYHLSHTLRSSGNHQRLISTASRVYKCLCNSLREYLATEESECRDSHTASDSHKQSLTHTVILLCTVVKAYNRLHTLIESLDNHNQQHNHTIDNAVSTNIYICRASSLNHIVNTCTAIAKQCCVDKCCDHRCAYIDHKWCKADRDYRLYNLPIKDKCCATEAHKAIF